MDDPLARNFRCQLPSAHRILELCDLGRFRIWIAKRVRIRSSPSSSSLHNQSNLSQLGYRGDGHNTRQHGVLCRISTHSQQLCTPPHRARSPFCRARSDAEARRPQTSHHDPLVSSPLLTLKRCDRDLPDCALGKLRPRDERCLSTPADRRLHWLAARQDCRRRR